MENYGRTLRARSTSTLHSDAPTSTVTFEECGRHGLPTRSSTLAELIKDNVDLLVVSDKSVVE